MLVELLSIYYLVIQEFQNKFGKQKINLKPQLMKYKFQMLQLHNPINMGEDLLNHSQHTESFVVELKLFCCQIQKLIYSLNKI